MTVVVNEEPVVQLVRLEDEPGIAMRPQPHGGADNTVPGRVDRGERDALPGMPRRFAPYRATAKSDTDRRHPRRCQERPPVHPFTFRDERILFELSTTETPVLYAIQLRRVSWRPRPRRDGS